MHVPEFEGWRLLGAFPDGEPDDVGSWLLVHAGEAMLLEIPPGLTAKRVRAELRQAGAKLRFATASHSHEDHWDADAWEALKLAFPKAEFILPSKIAGDRRLIIGGEPCWLVSGPKHSPDDIVTIFRGVAMTGDIELGMLESVNREVSIRTKEQSLRWLAAFPERTGYQVHSIVSAYL